MWFVRVSGHVHGPYLTKKIAIHSAMNHAAGLKENKDNLTVSVIHRYNGEEVVHKQIVPEPIPTSGDEDDSENL